MITHQGRTLVFSVMLWAVGTAGWLGIHSAGAVDSSVAASDPSLLFMLELPKVTVASLTSEALQEAPSTVSVLTQEDIRNLGVATLEELLNFIPGFITTRDVEQGRTIRISARGRANQASSSVLVLIDGQRINDLYTGGIPLMNRLIPVENIKQVEVIRGPGSALYGANAFLGVINIVTLTQANNLALKVGSNGQRSMAVNAATDPSATFHLSAFAKAFTDSGVLYQKVTDAFGQEGSTRDPVKGMDMYAALDVEHLKVRARYTERVLDQFLVFSALSNYRNWEKPRQGYINASYALSLMPGLEMDLSAGYLEDTWDVMALLSPADGVTLMEDMYGGGWLESYHAHGEASLRYRLTSENLLSGGVVYAYTAQTNVVLQTTHDPLDGSYLGGIIPLTGERAFNDVTGRSELGVYLQDQHAFTDQIKMTAGVRYDRYSDFGDTFNPRAALIYSSPWGGVAKAIYGQAFRAPNYIEFYDKNNPVDQGNPDLKPETVRTWELGYIQTLNTAQCSLTYFNNRISDLVVLDNSGAVLPPPFVNQGEQETQGLEFEAKAKLLDWLLVGVSATHFFNGSAVDVPKTFGSVYTVVKQPGWTVYANAYIRDVMAALPDQPAYAVANLGGRVNLTPGLAVTADIRNVADVSFITPSSTGVLVPNRGRTYTVGLAQEF